MKKISSKLCNDKYYNNKLINIISYLDKDDMKILEKLNIHIEDKKYTEYEFNLIEEKIFGYYLNEVDENVKTFFYRNKIDIKKYNLLLEKFNKIASDYNL